MIYSALIALLCCVVLVTVWGVHQAAGGRGQRSHQAWPEHGDGGAGHVQQPGPQQRRRHQSRGAQTESGRRQRAGGSSARRVVISANVVEFSLRDETPSRPTTST